MAAVDMALGGVSLPPTPALRNSVKCSSTGKFISILCDFGTVQILRLKVPSHGDRHSAEIVKNVTVGKAETLVGQAWSPDDGLFMVAGRTVYVFEVEKNFDLVHTFELYFHPNDVSVTTLNMQGGNTHGPHAQLYHIAIAGPNGVEISTMERRGNAFSVLELLPLHIDLAICLVLFSRSGEYLAVAALDCHFGIWNVPSLSTGKSEFWYVLLDTIRITDVAFSPDGNMVVVSCWDTSVHLFVKERNANSFTWVEVKLGLASRPDGKSPDASPGSFVCWAADNQMFARSQSRGISFVDLLSKRECLPLDLSPVDALKGIDSLRLPVGSDGILSFTRTKKLFLLQWPDGIRNSGSTEGRPPGPIDGQLTEENPSKNSDDNRLPFGIPSELYRGFLGTVSLLPDGKESCSLRWTLSRKRVREELETFENVVFAPPIRECKPEKDIFRREDCVKDEDEGCSEERISEGVSCKCQGSEFSDVSESLGAEPACVGLAGLCAGDRSGLLGREQQENDDKMASPLISSCKRGGGEPEIQLTHSLVGRIPSPSAFRKLTTKTTGEVSRPSACSKCGKIIRKHSFSDTGLSIDVKAPWFGTLWRCLPLITHRSLSACLFDDGDVEVLLSVDYLVVVIYPLLAHVYSSRAETWTELVFCGPVLRCCLVGGRYLCLLRRDGTAELRALDSAADVVASSTLALQHARKKHRPVMAGAAYHAAVALFDVDSSGLGKALYLTFDLTGEEPVAVREFAVCFPCLSRAAPALCSAHLLGHLVLTRLGPPRPLSNREGLDPSQAASTWTVLVPALNLAQNIAVDSDCDEGELFLMKHQDFHKLEVLCRSLLYGGEGI